MIGQRIEEDIELARRQAAKKGLPYQTYIKSRLEARCMLVLTGPCQPGKAVWEAE